MFKRACGNLTAGASMLSTSAISSSACRSERQSPCWSVSRASIPAGSVFHVYGGVVEEQGETAEEGCPPEESATHLKGLRAELARLQAENHRLLRLLELTPGQAKPPGPSQGAFFEDPPGPVHAGSFAGGEGGIFSDAVFRSI